MHCDCIDEDKINESELNNTLNQNERNNDLNTSNQEKNFEIQQNQQEQNLEKNEKNEKNSENYDNDSFDSDSDDDIKLKNLDQPQKHIKTISSTLNQNVVPTKRLHNVEFYSGQNTPFKIDIDEVHRQWTGDYYQLEIDHAYIQWIFPNKFSSRFNSNSYALEEEEIKIFKTDLQIAKRLVESYKMILDFYGMVLKDEQTGELERSQDYKKRYAESISGHNTLRIERILSHLNVVGFRRYAIKLLKFLNKEAAYKLENEDEQQDYPLKHLKHSYQFDRWQYYGECLNKQEEQNLERNTKQTLEQINEDSIFFRQ